MTRRVTVALRVELVLDAPDDSDERQVSRDFTETMREYLCSPESTFWADYGPEAWGGYEGPFLVSTEVTPA